MTDMHPRLLFIPIHLLLHIVGITQIPTTHWTTIVRDQPFG